MDSSLSLDIHYTIIHMRNTRYKIDKHIKLYIYTILCTMSDPIDPMRLSIYTKFDKARYDFLEDLYEKLVAMRVDEDDHQKMCNYFKLFFQLQFNIFTNIEIKQGVSRGYGRLDCDIIVKASYPSEDYAEIDIEFANEHLDHIISAWTQYEYTDSSFYHIKEYTREYNVLYDHIGFDTLFPNINDGREPCDCNHEFKWIQNKALREANFKPNPKTRFKLTH
jgi:hypothetical protein